MDQRETTNQEAAADETRTRHWTELVLTDLSSSLTSVELKPSTAMLIFTRHLGLSWTVPETRPSWKVKSVCQPSWVSSRSWRRSSSHHRRLSCSIASWHNRLWPAEFGELLDQELLTQSALSLWLSVRFYLVCFGIPTLTIFSLFTLGQPWGRLAAGLSSTTMKWCSKVTAVMSDGLTVGFVSENVTSMPSGSARTRGINKRLQDRWFHTNRTGADQTGHSAFLSFLWSI